MRLGTPQCARCGAPTAWPVERCRECSGRRLAFVSARAAVAYSGPARAFVHAWKERGLRRGALLAAELVADSVTRPPVDVITYVPADRERGLRRGYHPPEGLAVGLGDLWGLEVASLLGRGGSGVRQAGLGLADRRRNVRDAFRANRLAQRPATVVLVDDVYTTGATCDAAAGALRRAGIDGVYVITFARTVR